MFVVWSTCEQKKWENENGSAGARSNTFSLTVNRYSTSYQACSRTLRMPYVLLPGPREGGEQAGLAADVRVAEKVQPGHGQRP